MGSTSYIHAALFDLVPIHMMFRTYIMFYIHMMTKDVMEIDADAHHLLISYMHALAGTNNDWNRINTVNRIQCN
jgi:hypothetical protein